MKTLFKNAKIYDGTGTEPYLGSVLVEDDKIVAVGDLECDADNIIDLAGYSIASGFIDGHSHNDWFAIKKDNLKYFEPFIRQGITTFVCGNCGISAMGFGDTKEEDLGGGLFSFDDTLGAFGSFSQYMDAIDGKVPCNIASLVGHCSLRAGVGANAKRDLTQVEEEKMLALMDSALREGAVGLSLGLMYEPGLYANTDELKKVTKLCEKYDKPLTVHPRASSAVSMAYPQLLGRSHLLRALDELVEIAKGTKLKLHYSHAIFVGRKSFKNKDEFLTIIDDLKKSGVDAMFDIYNETEGVSVITVILPVWYQGMSQKERNKPLTKLKLSLLVKASSMLLGFGFKDIQIAYIGEGFEKYEGKTVHEIAKEEGISDLKAYLMLCEKSDFKGRVNMGPYTTLDIIHDFERRDDCLYMTDAWIEEKGVQNPSCYNCYPKFLRDSLVGLGDSMQNTIRKMTGAIADRFSLPQRGYVKVGYFADLTIFDENEIKNSTEQQKPFGIKSVYVNGKKVLDDQTLVEDTVKTTGMAIRVK